MSAVESEVNQAVDQASAPEMVSFPDGSTQSFSGKKKLIKDTVIDEAAGSVTTKLYYRNGILQEFTIPPSLLLKFAGHGAEQKLGDETAGTPEIDDMVLATEELIARLQKGEWSTKRESSGMAGTSVLLQALAEYKATELGLSDTTSLIPKLKDALSKMDQKTKMALRGSAELKPIVDRIEAAKAAKSAKVDTGSLLASL